MHGQEKYISDDENGSKDIKAQNTTSTFRRNKKVKNWDGCDWNAKFKNRVLNLIK